MGVCTPGYHQYVHSGIWAERLPTTEVHAMASRAAALHHGVVSTATCSMVGMGSLPTWGVIPHNHEQGNATGHLPQYTISCMPRLGWPVRIYHSQGVDRAQVHRYLYLS